MRRIALIAVAAASLAGCTAGPTADDCSKAQLAVTWAKQVLEQTCTKQSQACDSAGLALKVANISMGVLCPAGTTAP